MESFSDQDKLIREKSFLMMVPLFALAGLAWTIVYYYFGAKTSALIPGCYAAISFISLGLFKRYKNYNTFRAIQLTLILLLPCILHLSLGDFNSSSAVIIWAALCPLGALAFQGSKAASYWLLLFIAVLVLVFFLEHRIFPAEIKLPGWLVSVFFVLNISSVTFLTFFVMGYFVNQNELVKNQLNEEQLLLAAEREKSENLLLNILPASIAGRLKAGEKVIANEYEQVAILFADIVGFTTISQQITPEMLVKNLNKIFTHFDKLAEEYGLEKIKTIGDSYMVASGLTTIKGDPLKNIADFALSLISDIKNFCLDDKMPFDIRIGIDHGPVVAGVIGSKKFSYDVWGDAVNTASRMESAGEAGRIQVSERFYESVKEYYEFEYRGATEVKGKGTMKLYYLTGRKK